MSTNRLQFPELGWENKRMFEVPRARSGSTRFRGRFRRRLVQSQVRFNKICGHLTNGNPAEVFPALGFAARFRKICENKTLRLLGIPPKLIFSVFISGIKFIFVYLSMICIFFPRSRPGLADITMYFLIRIWERISHRLERVICIVLFHFDCDVVSSYFVIIFRTVFICFMSNLRVVSQRLSVNTSAGPCAQGLSGAWSKDQGNKERESENINSKGEMWKQCDSQRGKHIKTGIQHETNMKKMKKNSNMNQNGNKRNNTYLGKNVVPGFPPKASRETWI